MVNRFQNNSNSVAFSLLLIALFTQVGCSSKMTLTNVISDIYIVDNIKIDRPVIAMKDSVFYVLSRSIPNHTNEIDSVIQQKKIPLNEYGAFPIFNEKDIFIGTYHYFDTHYAKRRRRIWKELERVYYNYYPVWNYTESFLDNLEFTGTEGEYSIYEFKINPTSYFLVLRQKVEVECETTGFEVEGELANDVVEFMATKEYYPYVCPVFHKHRIKK